MQKPPFIGDQSRSANAESLDDHTWWLGLQYGIVLTKPQPQRKIYSGERVPLVVFFRNASQTRSGHERPD